MLGDLVLCCLRNRFSLEINACFVNSERKPGHQSMIVRILKMESLAPGGTRAWLQKTAVRVLHRVRAEKGNDKHEFEQSLFFELVKRW